MIGTMIHIVTTKLRNVMTCVHQGMRYTDPVELLKLAQSRLKFRNPMPPRPEPTNCMERLVTLPTARMILLKPTLAVGLCGANLFLASGLCVCKKLLRDQPDAA